ncbi:hypothetical protein [Burkholderia gladioli]|uniref:hypothetical protein n=1 Tax=Burkholderia gladioli TaxID=28095 RepID=UPI000F523523|nr:hypothetical protein [Burkholderia gladioli]MBU9426438.1 hypothetical protein [Burkholderia gladioli]MDN8063399.1 hypothetical protein [Burkholderia gladioli]
MKTNTTCFLTLAALTAVFVVILAYVFRGLSGNASANLIFWSALTFGGTGALIGFIYGRLSKAAFAD